MIVKGRFKTTVLGPWTSRVKAQAYADALEGFDILDSHVDEMPVNSDPPMNIRDWVKKFPGE